VVEPLEFALDAVKARDWGAIRSHWLDHLPSFERPGQIPHPRVADVPGVTAIVAGLARENDRRRGVLKNAIAAEEIRLAQASQADPAILSTMPAEMEQFGEAKKDEVFVKNVQYEKIEGIREAIFGEGMYLTHKAAHVLGVAEMAANQGVLTWSLSESYEASLLAAKALITFCGLFLCEVSGRTLLIDLFPGGTEDSMYEREAAFWLVGARLDHVSVWRLAQRALVKITKPVWPPTAVSKMRIVPVRNFGKQRNSLHYDNCSWILDDLHAFLVKGTFGEIKYWDENTGDYDFDRDDISLVVGHYLVRLVLVALTDIERRTAKIHGEMDVLRSTIEKVRHPLYYDTLIQPRI